MRKNSRSLTYAVDTAITGLARKWRGQTLLQKTAPNVYQNVPPQRVTSLNTARIRHVQPLWKTCG